MKDITFQASLDGAKLIARNQEATIVRRVQLKLGCHFDLEQAAYKIRVAAG